VRTLLDINLFLYCDLHFMFILEHDLS